MRLLSFDVGIKNLAYCLFEINSTTDYTVVDWDILNLCNETKHICCGQNKKGQACTFAAKYFKHDNFYCKVHAKNTTYKLPTTTMKCKNLKKCKLPELIQITTDYDISYNKPTKMNLLGDITNYIKINMLECVSEAKTNDFNLVQLGQNMEKEFSNKFNQFIDIVIIENQISPIANRMKTIQGMITQSFIIKNTPTIEYISASNKLKGHIAGKTTYNERKKIGIDVTQQMLTNTAFKPWQALFNNHKKKDDMADSFLQAIWYLKEYNLITID